MHLKYKNCMPTMHIEEVKRKKSSRTLLHHCCKRNNDYFRSINKVQEYCTYIEARKGKVHFRKLLHYSLHNQNKWLICTGLILTKWLSFKKMLRRKALPSSRNSTLNLFYCFQMESPICSNEREGSDPIKGNPF
jgi:hypothetical protein